MTCKLECRLLCRSCQELCHEDGAARHAQGRDLAARQFTIPESTMWHTAGHTNLERASVRVWTGNALSAFQKASRRRCCQPLAVQGFQVLMHPEPISMMVVGMIATIEDGGRWPSAMARSTSSPDISKGFIMVF